MLVTSATQTDLSLATGGISGKKDDDAQGIPAVLNASRRTQGLRTLNEKVLLDLINEILKALKPSRRFATLGSYHFEPF